MFFIITFFQLYQIKIKITLNLDDSSGVTRKTPTVEPILSHHVRSLSAHFISVQVNILKLNLIEKSVRSVRTRISCRSHRRHVLSRSRPRCYPRIGRGPAIPWRESIVVPAMTNPRNQRDLSVVWGPAVPFRKFRRPQRQRGPRRGPFRGSSNTERAQVCTNWYGHTHMVGPPSGAR